MRLLACLVGCLLLAGCGNQGGPRVPGVGIAFRVASTSPADGAVDVDPDTAITVEFAEEVRYFGEGVFSVADGAGELPGRFELGEAATSLRWTPARELPRGHRVTIRQNGFGAALPIATFTVRDAVRGEARAFQGLKARGVLAWSSGRRAFVTYSGAFEVSADKVVPIGVELPPDAWTYGDASFVWADRDPASGRVDCVRGDLDGAEVRVRTPADRELAACNSAGDVVVFVPNDVGAPTQRGLWRLDHLATQWQWVGPLELAAGATVDIEIDLAGNVMAAYARLGQPVLQRFEPGSDAPEVFEPAITGSASGVSFGVSDDGSGVLMWVANVVSRPLRAMRLVPGVGLQEIVLDEQTFSFETSVDRSSSGSTLLRYREKNGYGATESSREDAARLEASGAIGAFETVGTGTLLFGTLRSWHWDKVRGDYWVVEGDASSGLVRRSLRVRRSLPGRALGEEEPLFDVLDPDRAIKGYFLAIDASGRAVLAINEGRTVGLADTCRVVLLD